MRCLTTVRCRPLPTLSRSSRRKILPPVPGWRGVLVKSGTPDAVYTVLEDALKAAYESEAFQNLIEENGLLPAGYFGQEAQDTYAYTTQVQSWLLYDMGMANRSPEELDIPRAE